MTDYTDRSTEGLLARRAIAEKATPGPWANTDTVKELFHAAPCDWWNIYASGETIDLSYLIICRMSPRATEEEEQAARKISWADRNKMYDPGQAGKDAAYIAANSPDVVMDDIDEILRLRKEVKRLEKELKAAQDFASSQHEVAKLAWGGEIPSPLPGHPSMTEDEVCAMFEHLNCPWCSGSGHVGDCDEADQAVKRRLEHLEEEANWLATHLANALREPALIAHLHYLSNGLTRPPSLEMLREAAPKAVEEPCPKN